MRVYQNPRRHTKRWETLVEPLVPKDGKDRRFLDLGCNAGFYMKKAEELGYHALGVDSGGKTGSGYVFKAPKDLNIIKGDINYYKPPTSFITLLACVHYWQTEEQVEALFRKLKGSTLNLVVMGRLKRHPRHVSGPDKKTLIRELRGSSDLSLGGKWQLVDGRKNKIQYTALFKNPSLTEYDVDDLYHATREYILEPGHGSHEFYPVFEDYVKRVLNGDDTEETPFLEWQKRVRKERYPKGECWRYRVMIKDIQKNGMTETLKVRGERGVIDGHHRIIILQALGIKRVICRTGRSKV